MLSAVEKDFASNNRWETASNVETVIIIIRSVINPFNEALAPITGLAANEYKNQKEIDSRLKDDIHRVIQSY